LRGIHFDDGRWKGSEQQTNRQDSGQHLKHAPPWVFFMNIRDAVIDFGRFVYYIVWMILRHLVHVILSEMPFVEVVVVSAGGQRPAEIVFHGLGLLLRQDIIGELIRTPRLRSVGSVVMLRVSGVMFLGRLWENYIAVAGLRWQSVRLIVGPREVFGFVENFASDLRTGPFKYRVAVGPVIIAGLEVFVNRAGTVRRKVDRSLNRHGCSGFGNW